MKSWQAAASVRAMRTKEKWLPTMDLNHDKQIQSLLCYRYTSRQDCSHFTIWKSRVNHA
jgi:hypothetical protein